MSNHYLKTIDELVALYSVETNLKDVFVEGTIDFNVIKWFLRKYKRKDISVYPIDIIEISDDNLRHYDLPLPSNRSKLIALSMELSKHYGMEGNKILCIVDRDYDGFSFSPSPNQYLVFTDFNSIESYVIDHEVMDKFFSIVLGNQSPQFTIISQAINVLKSIFFIRLANEKLQWGMNWVALRRYIVIARDSIIFNETSYVDTYLRHNQKIGSKEIFLSKLAELKAIAPEEERLLIRGHDLIEIFYLIAKKLESHRDFGDIAFYGGAFLGCLEAQDMTKYSLFQRILSL